MTTTQEYRLISKTGSKGLKLHQASVPEPRENEVLVKIHAVSIQYRDLIISTGKYPFGIKENVVPGSDGAGEIIEVGADVKGWKKGDRVCSNFSTDHIAGDTSADIFQTSLGGPTDGVLTQYKIFPAHSLVHIPEHLSYEEASTLPCVALTAYNAFMGPVKVKAGDYVLVQGTGGVSIFALQFAVFLGATVIATSSRDEKLQVAKKLGAKHLINYIKTPNWDEEIMKITKGRGVDHIIEIGGPGTMAKSLKSARFGGWIHLIGFVAPNEKDKDAGDMFAACLGRSLYLRGILIGSRHLFEDMNRLITAAQLRPVIDKVFLFEETPEAYEYLSSQNHVGKVVIKVANN